EADAIHRRTPRRRRLTVVLGRAGTPEPVPFFPHVQAIVRHAAVPLSYQPAYRTRQEPVDSTQTVGDRNRTRCGLQRNELIYIRVSQGHGGATNRLPSWGRIAGRQADRVSPSRLFSGASVYSLWP